jgi:predicted DsbA family dithiol-disulfide isomerase
MAEASAKGINGVPAFFIDGQMLMGAQPYETFKAMIEIKLKGK